MNDATTQFLLESAEKLREQRSAVMEKLAYTAPEAITPQGQQWIKSSEAFIDLLDAVAASPDRRLQELTAALAKALLGEQNTTDAVFR